MPVISDTHRLGSGNIVISQIGLHKTQHLPDKSLKHLRTPSHSDVSIKDESTETNICQNSLPDREVVSAHVFHPFGLSTHTELVASANSHASPRPEYPRHGKLPMCA